MKIILHKNFEKKYKKLKTGEKKKFMERRDLFLKDPFNSILNNHALKGKKNRRFSINITGDVRAVYTFEGKDVVVFRDIDTHSNLYK